MAGIVLAIISLGNLFLLLAIDSGFIVLNVAPATKEVVRFLLVAMNIALGTMAFLKLMGWHSDEM